MNLGLVLYRYIDPADTISEFAFVLNLRDN